MTIGRDGYKTAVTRVQGDHEPAETAADLATALDELDAARLDLERQADALDDAHLALRDERARYAALFELAPTAFLVTDLRGMIREANELAADLLGMRQVFLANKPLAVFAADIRGFTSWLSCLPDEVGATQATELRLAPRRRRPFRTTVRVRRVRRPGAEDDELLWDFEDVEQRASAEEELRLLTAELEARVEERTAELEQERARLGAVLDQAPVGIVVAEAPSGRIVLANDRAARIIGADVSADGVEDYAAYRGFHPDGRAYDPAEWPLARSAGAGEVVTGEVIAIDREAGSPGFVEVSSTPIRRRDGAIAGAIAVFSDVTEREARERAEREFVTNAAHELQTPLAAIISAAEVLDAGAKDEPADRDRFLGHIRRECARLARLVHALLVLARAQTLAEDPPVEPIEVQPLLDELALSLHPAVGVEVRVECAPRLAALANRQLLEQAVANLAENAAKNTPAGTIWLAARPLGEESVAIEISDSGVGLVPGEEERLFERFYRSGSRDGSGSGLGLSIVRQAVEALGGDVELRRRPEGGTTAAIRIPRAAGAQETAA